MNGVALCHFCEQHGPSVIFCTQAFHTASPAFHDAIGVPASSVSAGTETPSKDKTAAQEQTGNIEDGEDLRSTQSASTLANDGAEVRLPTSARPSFLNDLPNTRSSTMSLPTQSKSSPSASSTPSSRDRVSSCPSCSSFRGNERGFVTHEPSSSTAFVSARFPSNPHVYAMLRQACVRSLSCEIAPGREGPLLFGDSINGYALSYVFNLKDSQARGMQRQYCFTFLMHDRIFLVASWPFLVAQLRIIIADMQGRALQTYNAEIISRKRQDGPLFGRALSSRSSLGSDAYLRRTGGSTTARSLTDIVGVSDYFSHIHACLSWLLNSCGSRLYEKHVSTLFVPPPSPPTKSSSTPLSALTTVGVTEGPEPSPRDEAPLTPQRVASDSSTSLPTPDTSTPAVTSLHELCHLLKQESFIVLVFNVSVGNQIIVRGDASDTVRSVLRQLQALLPPACVNALEYESAYRDSWQCNFLGLQAGVEVPAHVDKASYALLDIRRAAVAAPPVEESAESRGEVGEDMTSSSKLVNVAVGITSALGAAMNAFTTNTERNAEYLERFRMFSFQLTVGQARQRAPSVSSSRRDAVPTVVSNEKWNTFTSHLEGLLNLQPTARMLQAEVAVLRDEWSTKARMLFKVLRTAPGEREDSLRRFLKAFGLREADLGMLLFWITSISKEQRNQLLSNDTPAANR